MKKIICLIIALALFIVPSIYVSAETAENINFGVSNVVSDDKYDVTLRISTDYLCSGVQAVVKFDPSAITCTESATDEINISNGTIKISKVSAEDISGKWIDLKFTSPKMIFASDFTVSNVKGVKVINEKVSVIENSESFTYGDVKTDGEINILDLVRLKKMSTDLMDYTNAADCDLNGKADAADLVALRRLLLLAF